MNDDHHPYRYSGPAGRTYSEGRYYDDGGRYYDDGYTVDRYRDRYRGDRYYGDRYYGPTPLRTSSEQELELPSAGEQE